MIGITPHISQMIIILELRLVEYLLFIQLYANTVRGSPCSILTTLGSRDVTIPISPLRKLRLIEEK